MVVYKRAKQNVKLGQLKDIWTLLKWNMELNIQDPWALKAPCSLTATILHLEILLMGSSFLSDAYWTLNLRFVWEKGGKSWTSVNGNSSDTHRQLFPSLTSSEPGHWKSSNCWNTNSRRPQHGCKKDFTAVCYFKNSIWNLSAFTLNQTNWTEGEWWPHLLCDKNKNTQEGRNLFPLWKSCQRQMIKKKNTSVQYFMTKSWNTGFLADAVPCVRRHVCVCELWSDWRHGCWSSESCSWCTPCYC